MTTIHQRLRQRTAAFHDALEFRVASIIDNPTASSYAMLLAAMYGYYAPLEDALAQNVDLTRLGINLDERKKQNLIEADLQLFGVDAAAIERCGTLPATQLAGAALGCLYVLEGSTLGGRVIARRISSRLNVTPDSGLLFFTGYGAECGTMWREFLTSLERASADDAFAEETCQGAIDCFAKLDNWLERSLALGGMRENKTSNSRK
ncbi:MAG: biliverdin-producing heme oxygenase [Planctomycetaceae bacterium]